MTDPAGFLTLHETAARIGRYRWWEATLFETLGRWAAEVPETEARLLLETHAGHHGEHVERWDAALPVLWDLPADELVAAPPALVPVVAALTAATTTVERVAAAYRAVLPRLVAAYRAHLRAASPAADAPLARALGLVLHDAVDDLLAGEALLQGLLDADDAVVRAGAAQTAVERLVVEAGGVVPGQGS